MRGRPKLFHRPHQIAVRIEGDWFDQLSGEMLAEYRRSHPGAQLADLLRSLIGQGIAQSAHTATERERQRKEHRQQLRKLAVACVSASDDKLEAQARKLAALIGSD